MLRCVRPWHHPRGCACNATLVRSGDSWVRDITVKMSEHRTLAVRMLDAMAMRVAAPMLPRSCNVLTNNTPLDPRDSAQLLQLRGIAQLQGAHAKAMAFLATKNHAPETVLLAWEFTTQTVRGDSTQQKVMQYGMPLMFGAMSFVFPAGLTLYIFTNTILSALHSIWMNKFDKKSLAITAKIKRNAEAAAHASAVAAKGAGKPGAGGKNGKPTKPARPLEVIDVATDDATADDDNGAEQSTAGPPNQGRTRPKRKKRRNR